MASYSMTAVAGGSGGSGGAGGWTFIADSNNQLALADALTQAANDFDSRKGEMYGKIDSMGDHWKGEDYDMCNSSAHNYDPALQDFSDSIRMYASQFENNLEHFCGFFCVKEAFVKALDDDTLNYASIEILHTESGKPYINETPYIKSVLKEHFKSRIEISISHCKEYATAVVLVE